MLNDTVAEKLNAQVNSELFASHLYMSIAAYFASLDLTGMSKWFQAHSIEEHEHARKLFDFMENAAHELRLGRWKLQRQNLIRLLTPGKPPMSMKSM